jgi:hypothetical protein
VLEQVNFDEDPALADLGPRNLAAPRLVLKRHGVDLEQPGGLLQGERVHRITSTSTPSRPCDRLIARHVRRHRRRGWRLD